MDPSTRKRRIAEHHKAIHDLEIQEAAQGSDRSWPPSGFYLLWHLVVGMMLGSIAALVSLGANALGAHFMGKHPLELIRVYLTFPMGARALSVDEGSLLFVGCVIYLVTGALFGILFHLILTVYFSDASKSKRFLIATTLGLMLWIVNFYCVLSWLQPTLLGGDWIVRMVPPWVGALTHLAFAWTVAALEILGRFEVSPGGAIPSSKRYES